MAEEFGRILLLCKLMPDALGKAKQALFQNQYGNFDETF
jgi:hypothetical protein